MKITDKLGRGLLVVSALGSIGLSAHNTFQFMIETGGPIVAVIAVLALECGLVGLTLSLGKSNHWFFKFIQKSAYFTSAILIVLMLIATNTLNNIERLGIGISQQLQHLIQFVVLNGLIPLLVIVTTHAALHVVEGEPLLPVNSPVDKQTRHKELWPLVEQGAIIDIKSMASKYGVAETTIRSDIRSISKRIQSKNKGQF